MKSSIFLGLNFIAATLIVGCASGTQAMNVSRTNPAAYGEVEAKEEANGNTRIKINVEHLARPEAVTPTASTYVVWAQDLSGSGEAQNLGALQVDDKLKGKFETITPLKKFDIFITPEPMTTAQYPTGDRALWSTVIQ